MAASKKELDALAPLVGNFLVASPELHDQYFHRSIILLTGLDKDMVIGFVINKPAGTLISDLVFSDEFPDFMQDYPIMKGGPVETSNFSLAKIEFSKSAKGQTNHYAQGMISIEDACESALTPSTQVIPFHGHSAWTPDQLIQELNERLWYPMEMNKVILNIPEPMMWETAMQSLSPVHFILSQAPCNPVYN